ncbi:MAG: Gfo/Idh/MocA family oxidoreductase [Phycisphaerales bacterium]
MINVGVIGLGFMGRTHVAAVAQAARDGLPCRLAALCDRDPSRFTLEGGPAGNLRTAGERGAIHDAAAARTATDPRELLSDPAIDAVIICTHTETHVDLALAALAAGKHVLIEKPVALRSTDVARVARAAREARRLAMPAMCMRFWPGWAWLRNVIATRDFGPVRSAVFQRLGCPPTWSSFYADVSRSGGPLFDLHVHDSDFIRHALGEPSEVVSTGSVQHVTTLYRFESGPAHVVGEGGLDHTPGFGFRMRYVVALERATADFDLGRTPTLLLHREGRSDPVDLPALSAFDAEVRHFIEQCAGPTPGAEPPRATIDDAVATTRLLEAEQRSLQSGRPERV